MAPRVDGARPAAPAARRHAGRQGSSDATPELTERSRDRILSAALTEFANRGFDGTTTAEIARRAGVTQPLVHYHFDSKDSLWYATVTAAFDAAGATSLSDLAAQLVGLELIDQLKVLMRGYVRFCAANPDLARIVSYESVQGGPRLAWLAARHAESRYDLFDQLVEQAVEDGLLKDLPRQHVLTSVSAAGAYLFIIRAAMLECHGIDTTDPDVIEAHADTVVELMFHGLVREGVAP